MQLTTETTVRDIATGHPASIRVFESLGIDYCCGGRMSLADSCSRAALDVNRVLQLLENADRESRPAEATSWSDQPLRELTAHIVEKHHRFVRSETPRIDALLSKVAAKHGPAHRELLEIERLFQAIAQELSTHMMKEEQILFPYIERLEHAVATGGSAPPSCFGSVQRPIATMIAEHEDAGALLARIRELSGAFVPPSGACPSFIALYRALDDFEHDLHHHVHLENNILFPRAIQMER